MMITLCRDAQRHHTRHGKSDIWHTFYPQDLQGPLFDGFGALAFLSEMRLPPGKSAAPQAREDAEIITHVYRGTLAQGDSSGSVTRTGEFQRMTTAHGTRPEETNASGTDWAHVFRITLHPCDAALDSACDRKRFTAAQRRNMLFAVASPDERMGSLRIQQDAVIYSSILDPGHHLIHELKPGRSAWLHIVSGEATMDDVTLTQGDGVGVTAQPSVSLTVKESTEILLVDLGAALSSFGRGANW
ncbi:MAG: pirin family protein [bacterium]